MLEEKKRLRTTTVTAGVKMSALKIHVQMKDDMPSAINETTPCLLDDLLVLNEFEAGQTSKPRSLICYEKRIWHSKYLQVFSMLITSLYVKLQTR